MSNDFSNYYKILSNTELLDILENQEDFQPVAVEAAKKEFENRQLSEKEIKEVREPLIKKKLEKEKQREKAKAIQRKVRSAGTTLADTLNPIQTETPSVEKLIRIISIVFMVLFLYQIIGDFRMFSLMMKDFKRFDSSTFLYFLPIVLLPVATITFWRRKIIGWMLLTFFIIYSAMGVMWMLIESFTWRSSGTTFDTLFPRPSPLVYIIQIAFLGGTLYVICRTDIREAFKIGKERLITTFFVSGLVTVFLMYVAA